MHPIFIRIMARAFHFLKMFTLVCTNGFSKPCTTLTLMQAEIRLQLKGGTPVVFALLFWRGVLHFPGSGFSLNPHGKETLGRWLSFPGVHRLLRVKVHSAVWLKRRLPCFWVHEYIFWLDQLMTKQQFNQFS